MEGEGEQIEHQQDRGERFLAVPKVVFDVISAGLKNIERFVLDFPACASTAGEFSHGGGDDRQSVDEAIVVRSLVSGVQSLGRKPVHGQRVFGGAQRHGGKPPVNRGGAFAARDDGLAVLAQFGAGEVFSGGLIRRRFAV